MLKEQGSYSLAQNMGHKWPVLRHRCIGPGGVRTLILFNVNKRSNSNATVCRHLFTAESLYMFRVSQHPSSGVLKTVTATSGISHGTGTATSFHRGLIGTNTILFYTHTHIYIYIYQFEITVTYINYKHFANMKRTIYGNWLPGGTKGKKCWELLT